MKFIKYMSLSIVTFLLLFTLGCSNNSKKAIDFGKFEEGIYSNTFFNLNISIPESWYVMDDESRITLMQKSKKIVAGDDKNLNAAFNAADLQNFNLMTASEKAPGAPVSTNPSIIVIAESIKHAPGITKGSDYHFHTKKMMESSQLDVLFSKDIYEETINGKMFEVMEMEIIMGSVRNIQKQYAAMSCLRAGRHRHWQHPLRQRARGLEPQHGTLSLLLLWGLLEECCFLDCLNLSSSTLVQLVIVFTQHLIRSASLYLITIGEIGLRVKVLARRGES